MVQYAPVNFVKVTIYSVYVYGRETLCYGGLPMFLHRDSTREYLDTITLGVLINNYCYGKSHVGLRITRDFLFVDLHKEPNSLILPDFHE